MFIFSAQAFACFFICNMEPALRQTGLKYSYMLDVRPFMGN